MFFYWSNIVWVNASFYEEENFRHNTQRLKKKSRTLCVKPSKYGGINRRSVGNESLFFFLYYSLLITSSFIGCNNSTKDQFVRCEWGPSISVCLQEYL